MEGLLSQVGLFSIYLIAIYIIKKFADYHNDKDEENTIYKFEEDDEI